MNIKKILAGAAASVLAVTTFATLASAETAGLVFQTNAWTFRNNINQSKAVWWNTDGDAEEFDTWNVSDANITADGTYTVSFEKNIMEDCKDGPEAMWNFLKLQTDISAAEYPDLQVTIDSLKVDGKEIEAGKSAILGSEELKKDDYSDIDSVNTVADAYVVGFYNKWNEEQTCIASEDFGGKVEVTFTVTGFKAADNNGGDATEAPSTDAPSTDKPAANTGIEGVAVVAGLAVLATGAIVIAKKRK